MGDCNCTCGQATPVTIHRFNGQPCYLADPSDPTLGTILREIDSKPPKGARKRLGMKVNTDAGVVGNGPRERVMGEPTGVLRPKLQACEHALAAEHAARVAAEGEVERLRHGLPRPDSIRYGIEPEPWEGDGPCQDCEGRSPMWHAPNDLWDSVMGDGERMPGGVICPVCFAIRAWKKGLPKERWYWAVLPMELIPVQDLLDAYAQRNEEIDLRVAAEGERDRLREALVRADALTDHPTGEGG
jgi:hypothetical protein